uniref:RNA-dependent RNA polymerase n=1 Tax=Plasmopara viticola lesion associated mitovirus 42 TaxID=2719470 RepID=A0A6G9RTN6_9VIRU|nr:RNA-dependent RNA polymerase [Plasmopara viticola lesion associated mitovirus 42]
MTYLVLNQICKTFFTNIPNSSYYIGKYFQLMTKLLKQGGTVYTVKYLKTCRLHVTRYLAGQPILESDIIDVFKDGIPSSFEFLYPIIKSNSLQDHKFLMTLLMVTRCIKPKKGEKIPFSLDSITDPFTGKSKELDINVIRKVMKQMKISKQDIPKFDIKDVTLNIKAGPNGPGTLSSWATILYYNYKNFNAISGLTCKLGFEWVMKHYRKALEYNAKPVYCKHSAKGQPTIRRLSIVHDPECKMRIIAIFDFWSQTLLEYISKDIFNILKKIPSDRTYSQNPKFHIQHSTKNNFHSIDLSSATDRFPVEFQVQILKELYNEQVAQSWKDTMVGERFLEPTGTNYINYAVGQPMGAKSSWPVFTLSHHILVRYAAYELNYKNFSHYIMLGDDIVINNDRVSKRYKQLLAFLGVETSDSKTHTSKHLYEFAKRWIDTRRGELTGLPIRGIVNNFHDYFTIFITLFDYIHLKGNPCLYSGSLSFVVGNLITSVNRRLSFNSKDKKIKEKAKRFSSRKIIKSLTRYNVFMRYHMGIATYDELRTFLVHSVSDDYQIPHTFEGITQEIERLTSNAMVGIAWNTCRKLPQFMNQLDDKYAYGDKAHPLFLCISNHLTSYWDVIMQAIQKKISLQKALTMVTLLDPEAISSYNSRDKIQEFLLGRKLCDKFVTESRFDSYQMTPRQGDQALRAMADLHLKFSAMMAQQSDP